LCDDIARAFYTRDHAFDLFGGSNAKADTEFLQGISKELKKIEDRLKAKAGLYAQVEYQLKKDARITPSPFGPCPLLQTPQPFEQLQGAIGSVQRSREHVGAKWRHAHEHDTDLRGRRVTEKEWLAGVSLPLVFEMHFLTRAGRSRNKAGKPIGPMVKFIGATMIELGLAYSDESIVRAYSLRAPLRKERDALPGILRQI